MSTHSISGFRLSTQQQRVWSQHAGDSGFYRAECDVILDGPLDAVHLQKAFECLIHRHEILRTVFYRQPGLKFPFQIIEEGGAFAWRREFNLEQGPILSARLEALEPGKHVLRLSLPALCADSRTLHNLVGELGRAYASCGRDDGAEEVMQYAGVVEWQQDLLTGEDGKAGREFWKHYLRRLDIESSLSMLAAFEVRSEPAEFRPDVVAAEVDPSLLSKLAEFCSREEISMADFVLTCWHVFLSRMTGRPEVIIAHEFDGRNYAELEDALGLFSKYIPLSFSYQPEAPFRMALDPARNLVSAARNWQDAFSWQDLGVPVLPVAYEYSEEPEEGEYAGVRFRIEGQDARIEGYRLKLAVRRGENALRLEFHYDAGSLARDTVKRWSDAFQTLLIAAVENPDTAVGRLPLLNPQERLQMLVEWNQTAAEFPRQQCFHDLFEAQAARTPDRTAVRCGERELTYHELNQKANRLAHHLQSVGVVPEALVGLCLDRSVEMIVGLLAILKVGGAYVPLSADNPKARLAQQLAGASALITESNLIPVMPEFGGPIVCIDKDADTLESNPELTANPENLAYVIYTSGSTGVPKGVGVRHRNLVNYAHFMTQRLELDRYPEGLHFATVTTLSADLGNTCIFPALMAGGCLHVIPQDMASDSARMGAYHCEHPLDVLKIVPSHLEAMLATDEGRHVLPRRHLILGGEALPSRLVNRVRELGGECEIWNHYGPTETTVGSLTLRLKDHTGWGETVPIGRPIANTQVYILDAEQQPVPVGVAGELYIAGDGVTAGYLNQPERTAERFLDNPFGQEKMYRTGDLVRYRHDGNVEFLGRADDQVKIRGYRIELGEVESLLARHPQVRQAVAMARPDPRGDLRLIAYVVNQPDSPPSSEQLRDYLKQQLPDHMIPAAIITLPKLPLTANGKVDRAKLPEPEDASQPNIYVAPRTATERAIARIWCELFRRDRIGTGDNFFDIGGHSLLATQVISRVRRDLSIDPPLRLMFESPTIAALSEWVDQARGSTAPAITRVSRESALPLSFAQQRLWVLDQLEPHRALYNIPRALRLKGTLDVEALGRALNEIVRRHESQRTTFAVVDGTPVQVIAPSLDLALPIQDLAALPETERESAARQHAREEALRPFDLAQGPLVRAQLIRLASKDHVLLYTAHHIVSDAWSASIFFEELSALYEAFSHDRPSPLPELPIQYADYAAWQRRRLQGDYLNELTRYWREQLKGAPPLLDLPLDRPRSDKTSFAGSAELISFSPQFLESMKRLAKQEDVTLFMTLLAGFQALLSRYSGEDQIVVGTDVANRTSTETERLIGFFINLVPLRLDLSGDPTFRELLARVRESALGAYAHQDMPFDKLVEALQPERVLGHNPLVQVLFVMQNIPSQQRELAGLDVTSFAMPLTQSKFDLAVFVRERENSLVGTWVYRTDLFDRETIQRIARHFERLLTSAAELPESRLSTLEILTDNEKKELGTAKLNRKQSQRKKLIAIEPEPVRLSSADGSRSQ